MASVTGDLGMTIRKVAEDLQKLKAAYDGKDSDKCEELLTAIKRRMILFPTFLNPFVGSATRSEELMLAREVLEMGVLVSARQKDLEGFDLYFSQLQLYYTDVDPKELPVSPQYMMLLGLNLVRLLVLSQIAKFHSELEKIPSDAQGGNPYIRFAVQLERFLMEGSYNKLLTSRKKAPSNEYIPVVEMLETTVRQEVANCIPHSYTILSVPAAKKILMVGSTEEVLQIGREHEWQLSADGNHFVFTREEDKAKKEIPFKEMIKQHISFVADLQNIV